ncbi:MAG: hypothetical protein ACKVS6_11765 [Planctomycetota bacterium]
MNALHNKAGAGAFCCLLIFIISACGGTARTPAPEGAVLSIDNEFVTTKELDEIVTFLLETLPHAGEETVRASALEGGLLPRALARNDFPEGVARAREQANVAMQMLKSQVPFEDVQLQLSKDTAGKPPVPISRRIIDPILGAAVFGKPAGYVTKEPVECTYGVLIARVDLAIPEAGLFQQEVILSTIEFPYDVLLLDINFRRERNIKRMLSAKYTEITPGAFRWLPPAIRNGLPAGGILTKSEK